MEQAAIKKSPYILSSLDNALKVLDILSVKDNIGLAELTKISNLDKSSLFKLLFTLERRDYVFKTAEGRYRLGVKFANYGTLVSERQSMADIAMPALRALRDLCHETVYLASLNTNGKVIVMHMEAGNSPGSIVTRIGYELEAYTNAMGKALLAYLEPSMQQSIVEQLRFKPYTAKTILSAPQLMVALEAIRSCGYAQDTDERHVGHSALAVPVFDATARCVATVSIVCSNSSLEANSPQFLEAMLTTAENISHKLGF